MAYDPNVLRRASARLEEEKRRREDEREQLRRQTYAREPRLAQLDRRLQGTMAELVAASLRKGENAGDAVRAIRDKNLELQPLFSAGLPGNGKYFSIKAALLRRFLGSASRGYAKNHPPISERVR